MKKFRPLLLLMGVSLLLAGSCEKEEPQVIVDTNPYHQFLFYNVENLFDTLDQKGKKDEEFLPNGEKEWDTDKLFFKLDRLGKVIKDANPGGWPALIGVCEIENRSVMELMLAATDMKDAGYQIVHKESPDFRGIDVGLFYRSDVFELLDYSAWPVYFPFDNDYVTREVLYVKGTLDKKATLHVFVNHWPSRSGGEMESRPKRIFVAEMVRTKVDSILKTDPKANIIITGDFNDEPNDISIVSGLTGLHSFDDPQNDELYALSKHLMDNSPIGSYKYKGNWNFLDQFVVSGNLLDTTQVIYCRPDDLGIVDKGYLFEEDDRYMGKKPYRSFLGDYFHKGYSDHLPVYLQLRYR